MYTRIDYKMKIYYLVILWISLFMSYPTYAHAGHDHSSIFASLIHLLWLAPILMVLVFLHHKLLKNNYQI